MAPGQRAERRPPGRLVRALGPLALAVAAATPAAAGGEDPLVSISRLRLAGREAEALTLAEEALLADPAGAAARGLDYLRADLLERLGRPRAAAEAFAAAIAAAPHLSAHARLRLARNQEEQGHPEVAAGLLATLLGDGAPPSRAADAARALFRTVAAGGDCRLLRGSGAWDLPLAEKRLLELEQADCLAREEGAAAARTHWLSLLRRRSDDGAAFLAAERLSQLGGELALSAADARLAGSALAEHREFAAAVDLLRRGGVPASGPLLAGAAFDLAYALARGLFWLERFAPAAEEFAGLAARAPAGEPRARALFQHARSLELAGSWDAAARAYAVAGAADPAGRWAGAALLARVRLEWLAGREPEALAAFRQLAGHAHDHRARAAVFLAASDLVRGRADRAGGWLDAAALTGEAAAAEVAYWSGRLAEIGGDPAAAVRHYLRALSSDSAHPLAVAGLARLASPRLAAAAEAEVLRLLASGRPADLAQAWLLRRADPHTGAQLEQRLRALLSGSPRARSVLELRPAPVEAWPSWGALAGGSAGGGSRPAAEDALLALSVWGDAETAIRRHFPAGDAPLALAASQLLTLGGRPDRGIYMAELVARRSPAEVPARLLSVELRRMLYPLPYRETLVRETARRGVAPHLLAALIREESRFDAGAISAAQARGLAQFTMPTARRVAATAGLGVLRPWDLERPAVSIILAAAYLGELGERFRGHLPMMLAAYNAGEPQARLWRAYCQTAEPEEYLSKVGFRETREYLRKVLSSLERYRELYPELDRAARGPRQ